MAGINGTGGPKKEALTGLKNGKCSIKVTIQVQEHPLEVGFVQDFLVLGDTQK
jgi:hypothetical protein